MLYEYSVVAEVYWLPKSADSGEKSQSPSSYPRSLIEASLNPLVTISANGKIIDVNKATELVTGCSREQLIRIDFSDYFTKPYVQINSNLTNRNVATRFLDSVCLEGLNSIKPELVNIILWGNGK